MADQTNLVLILCTSILTDFGSLFGWLVADGWFVLREQYCWLVADLF
jgi:hypothetical protein